jgi:hypothetical protein
MLVSRAGAGEARGEPRGDAPPDAKGGGAAPAKKGGKFDDLEDDIPF